MNLLEKLLSVFQQGTEVLEAEAVQRAISSGQISTQVESALWAMDVWGEWLIDVFYDAGEVYAVTMGGGLLKKYPVMIDAGQVELGEPMEVEFEFPEVARTTIQRSQVNGKEQVRWFSVSCTATINRDHQIDSGDLFDSFVEHIERTGNYPIRNFYHLGAGLRTGQADFVARAGHTLITSGLYDDSEIARAEIAAREADPDYWGESVGYVPTQAPEFEEIGGVLMPIRRAGIMFEIATCPEDEASALFTAKTSLQFEEVTRMNAKQKAAFVKLFGGDESKAQAWLDDNPNAINRALDDDPTAVTRTAEVETEAAEDETTEEVTAEAEAAESVEAVTQVEVTEEFMEALSENAAFMNGVAERLAPIGDLQQRSAQNTADLAIVSEVLNEMQAQLATIATQLAEVGAINQQQADVQRAVAAANQVDSPVASALTLTFRPAVQRAAENQTNEDPEEDKAAKALERLPAY